MPKAQFSSKICPVCGVDKPRSDYYRKGSTVSHKCKPCTLQDAKARAAQYFGKYDARQNNWRRERYKADPAYRERIAIQKKERYDRINSELNEKRRERWANDPLNPARKYYRRKDVKDKTPKWVDLDEILAIHAKCPPGYEVDHIVPLRGLIDGRPVTGLHVPWNLQYLTTTQNRKKRNRISECDIEGVVWG